MTLIDLTGDSSAENSPAEKTKISFLISSQSPQRVRQPRNDTNDTSKALDDAIDIVDETWLKLWLKNRCRTNQWLRSAFEKELLVQGKDVVPYHADTDSEEDNENHRRGHREQANIAIGSGDHIPRFADCSNCKEKFDVTANRRGDCEWHPGNLEICDDDDFWADHDENCHGRIDDLMYEADDTWDEGFKYDCCGNFKGSEGCMVTKHKAYVNLVVPSTDLSAVVAEPQLSAATTGVFQNPANVSRSSGGSQERKTDTAEVLRKHHELIVPSFDYAGDSCAYYHPGEKEVNVGAECWEDHDEDVNGSYDDFKSDWNYQSGFCWTCCDREGSDRGCRTRNHELKLASPLPGIAFGNQSKKRKAEQQLEKPKEVYCDTCDDYYHPGENSDDACYFHPGPRSVQYDAKCWSEHNPDVNGPYEDFKDDRDYANGFVWDCCDSIGDAEGCMPRRHGGERQ